MPGPSSICRIWPRVTYPVNSSTSQDKSINKSEQKQTLSFSAAGDFSHSMMPFHQRMIVLGQAHGDEILAAHDIGRIGRIQIGRIKRGGGKALARRRSRTPGAETERRSGPNTPLLPRKPRAGIKDIGKSKIDVALAAADPEQMPMMGIGPGWYRDNSGRLLVPACAPVNCPAIAAGHATRSQPSSESELTASGKSASCPINSPTRPIERSRTFQSLPAVAQALSAVFRWIFR